MIFPVLFCSIDGQIIREPKKFSFDGDTFSEVERTPTLSIYDRKEFIARHFFEVRVAFFRILFLKSTMTLRLVKMLENSRVEWHSNLARSIIWVLNSFFSSLCQLHQTTTDRTKKTRTNRSHNFTVQCAKLRINFLLWFFIHLPSASSF